MKIIKRPDANWTKALSCSKCSSQLEADIGDLRKKFNKGYDDHREPCYEYWSYHVVCPVCSHLISIPEKEINYAVQQKAVTV